MFLSHEIKCYLQCRRTDIHVLELFCRASHARASRHRITSLELSKNTNAVFSEVSNCKATDAEKPLSQGEKVLNAILRLKLKYMKDVSFSLKEMLFAMQKTDLHVLELFCRASHVRASIHRITRLRASKNTNAGLVQLSKWRECKATDAKRLLSQW